MKLAITSVSSQAFAYYICALARSVGRNAPGVYMRVHLVNPSDETVRSAKAAVAYGEVTVEHITLAESEVAGYCSNSRVRITREMLQGPYDAVINLDADALVRGDITQEATEVFKTHDVLLFRQSRLKVQEPGEKLYFLASMSMFKNSPGGRRFVEAWVRELEPMAREWFGDQIALYRAYDKTRAEVQVGDIPDVLIDTRFSRSGLVWMAKGNRKYGSALYQLELAQYDENVPSFFIRVRSVLLQEWFRCLAGVARLKKVSIGFLLRIRSVFSSKK